MGGTSSKVMGIPMQRQEARRQLVVGVYVVLAAICGASVALAPRYPLLYAYAVYPALAVGMLVFGGQGHRGLLKGFANKPPRPDAPQMEMMKLNLAPRMLVSADASGWKNDERELSRRDRAHYKAYQVIGTGWIVALLLVAFALAPRPHPVSTRTLLVVLFGLAEAMAMLVVTLPAAIILWSEPDMELE
jgi:FtsH-binding integral membrane protein